MRKSRRKQLIALRQVRNFDRVNGQDNQGPQAANAPSDCGFDGDHRARRFNVAHHRFPLHGMAGCRGTGRVHLARHLAGPRFLEIPATKENGRVLSSLEHLAVIGGLMGAAILTTRQAQR